GEDVDQGAGKVDGLEEVGPDGVPKRRGPGGPDVRGEQWHRPIGRACWVCVIADVERLEQVRRALPTQAVGQRLRTERCISPVDLGLSGFGERLLLDGQTKKLLGGGQGGVDHRRRYAMS